MEGDLAFIADRFYITTSDGTEKLFRLLDTWELLNLRPDTVLDLPAMLYQQFGISEQFLHATLEKYSIQNMGTVALNARFWIEKPMQFVLGKTNHYSWGKGGGMYLWLAMIHISIRDDNFCVSEQAFLDSARTM